MDLPDTIPPRDDAEVEAIKAKFRANPSVPALEYFDAVWRLQQCCRSLRNQAQQIRRLEAEVAALLVALDEQRAATRRALERVGVLGGDAC